MIATVKRFSKVGADKFNEENGVKNYQSLYIAETDSSTRAFEAIRRRAAELQRWQPHPEDPLALSRRFAIEQRKHSLLYDITVDYSTNAPDDETDPTSIAAVIECGTASEVVPAFVDANKVPLSNTAGVPMELTKTVRLPTFSIRKNIPLVPTWFLDYAEAVNIDTVRVRGLTCKPRTLKIAQVTIGNEQIANDIPYSELRLDLIYNKNTWDKFFLNRGFEEVVFSFNKRNKMIGESDAPSSGETIEYRLERILDEKGQPLSEPAFLDEDGRRPRIDKNTKKRVSIKEEIQRLRSAEKRRAGSNNYYRLKQRADDVILKPHPLDFEDIVILRRSLEEALPFSILPLE